MITELYEYDFDSLPESDFCGLHSAGHISRVCKDAFRTGEADVLFLATEGNEILGYAAVGGDTDRMEIIGIISFSKGTGRQIVEHIKSVASENGSSLVISSPTEKAQDFWVKMGCREEDFYFDDGVSNDVRLPI